MSYEKNIDEIIERIRETNADAWSEHSGCLLSIVTAVVNDIHEHGLTYVEATEAKRMREETITVRTTWNSVHQIEQLVGTPTAIMQRRVLNTMERQTRDGLAAMGWIAPALKR